MNELEPLPPELAELKDQLPASAPSVALKAKVWARVAASGAPWAATTTAVGLASKFGAWGIPLALAALVGGGVAGVILDREVLAPKIEVTPPPPLLAPVIPTPAPPAPAPAIELTPTVRPKPIAPPAVASGNERQLIEAARTALLKRDPTAALEAIAKHRAEFAKGQLAEERDSLEVQAFLQLGQVEQARTAAKTFLARFPNSVFGPAVEAALGE